MKWFLFYLNHVVHPYSMFDCNSNLKFNDFCKPEKCLSGQPKYCLEKINTLCYQLWSVFGVFVFLTQHLAPCNKKGIQDVLALDSGFHGVDSGFQILDADTLSVELGFRILNSSWWRDSGFLELYSWLQTTGFWIPKQKFVGFRFPQVIADCRIRIPLHASSRGKRKSFYRKSELQMFLLFSCGHVAGQFLSTNIASPYKAVQRFVKCFGK